MSIRLRKLIGAVVLIVLVVTWALVAMALAQSPVIKANGLIDELGMSDQLTWRDSKVGFFNRGRIWPFVTPLDLLRFRPLPLIDRVRLGDTNLIALIERKRGRTAEALQLLTQALPPVNLTSDIAG